MLVVFAAAALLGVATWGGRPWLLRSAAEEWIVSDPLGPADVVAVLGGGVADRPFAAAQYYRQGWVTKILVDEPDSKAVLLKLGVPESAIEIFGQALGNTHQETLALRAWAEQHNLHSIIVPTGIFSTHRVQWMLHRVFPHNFVIRIAAIYPPNYSGADWWKNNDLMFAFEIEVMKYLYYRVRY
jgi:uncharacterized SAM-binding protein YcdF (DUF218 family)